LSACNLFIFIIYSIIYISMLTCAI
jgi:hypothetical protein